MSTCSPSSIDGQGLEAGGDFVSRGASFVESILEVGIPEVGTPEVGAVEVDAPGRPRWA